MKKNILIITVGTRDVQTTYSLLQKAQEDQKLVWVPKPESEKDFPHIKFGSEGKRISVRRNTSQDFKEFLIFNSPREDTEQLIEIPFEELNWLTFPLIERPLDWLIKKEESVTIDSVLTVYTNQQKVIDGVQNYHWKNDTLNFNKLIQSFLKIHPATSNATFTDYPIEEEPVNIDYQYNEFEKKKGGLLSIPTEEIQTIYLLAQGGIDQINTALTLKLIEHFPGKVIYLQQPEDKPVVPRDFPTVFVQNLIKGKVEPALDRYEFGTVETLVDNPVIKQLASLGATLRGLDVRRMKAAFIKLWDLHFENQLLSSVFTRINNQSEDLTKQELIFLSALIALKLEDYNEATWRLRTLGEILLAPNVKLYLNLNDLSDANTFTNTILSNRSLGEYFEQKVSKTNGKWHANAFALQKIFDYQFPKNKPEPLNKTVRLLESINYVRNDLVHSAKSVTRNDIETALSKNNQTIYSVEENLLTYFKSVNININGFGIYDTIRDEIHKLL